MPAAHESDYVPHHCFERGRIDVSERASREVALNRVIRCPKRRWKETTARREVPGLGVIDRVAAELHV